MSKVIPFQYVDCPRCADLERQLAEAQGKLEAVQVWRDGPRDKGSMAELDRILSKEGKRCQLRAYSTSLTLSRIS